MIDDQQYWRRRHAQVSDLKASGSQAVNIKGNQYIYKLLAEQYKKLLVSLGLAPKSSVIDCGFGDGYFLSFFKKNFPQFKLYGVDISADAKNKAPIRDKSRLKVASLTQMKFNRSFDVVHSFDVLYHVLGDDDYAEAIANMARHSKRYIILHERFLSRSPLVTSKHVRLRPASYTDQLLNSHGFYLYKSIPSHFVALRLLTFRLNKYFPRLLYRIDAYIARRLNPSTQHALASHFVRVYKRAE